MGRTHKAGGCLAMLVTYSLLQKHNFMPDVHPLVQLLLMYPAASWGSTMPDLDQNFNSIPEKTPVSIAVHKLLHLGKVRHRSWQTHSLFVMCMVIGMLYLMVYCASQYTWFGLTTESCKILTLLVTGLAVGIGSHLLLDLMTYDGIQLTPGVWIRFFRFDIFKTGTTYEKIVRVLLYIACAVTFVYICVNSTDIRTFIEEVKQYV